MLGTEEAQRKNELVHAFHEKHTSYGFDGT